MNFTPEQIVKIEAWYKRDIVTTYDSEKVMLLLADWQEMNAVIKRLPKTNDGVSVVRGVDRVFWVAWWENPPCVHEGIAGRQGGIVRDCYSTRELAEAAMLAKGVVEVTGRVEAAP
jgi:hypothetical protein